MSNAPFQSTRRSLIAGSITVAAGAAALGVAAGQAIASGGLQSSTNTTGTVTGNGGTRVFYKDWGKGPTVVFSHGWPLTADAWDGQMLFLGQRGYRVVAHDRRSHGRSDQTWDGNNMDTYADDLAAVIDALDLRDIVLVGHSTGGGEIAHYIGRYGTGRVAKVVLVGAVPPQMVASPNNPDGLPMSVFDDIRKQTFENRSQFFRDLTTPFYGFNQPGAPSNQDGLRDSFWLQGMMGGIKGQYDCIREFSEVDYTPDLQRIDKPTLVVHGDADQIVPIGASALKSAQIVRDAKLKVYPGAPHGLAQTHMDRFNADLLAFIKS
jgi:non-heme chloroperoxidase